MDCRDALERLSDHQDGALDSVAAEALGAHLRECTGCAEAARTLAAVREGLRQLPPLTAPPELAARVREAVAREGGPSNPVSTGAAAPAGARSLLSRLRIPLEAAAAVLLVASIWWYQKGTPTGSLPPSPPAPAGTAAPAQKVVPGSSPRLPEKTAKPPERESRLARKPAETPPADGAPKPAAAPPASATAGKAEVASLPARDRSRAELPAAPAVRASSESARIVPAEVAPPAAAGAPESQGGAMPGARKDASPVPAPRALAAPPARLLATLPYGREIVLDVTPEAIGDAGDKVAAAARRLGGAVERIERDPSGTNVVAVRVLLPEPAAPAFLSELDRIGKVPPEGKPAEADIPAGPTRGMVAYTVRIRVR